LLDLDAAVGGIVPNSFLTPKRPAPLEVTLRQTARTLFRIPAHENYF